MYNSASNRHHQLTEGKLDTSEDEWMALIEEFEAIVAANPGGDWADDAQYAIGSCWIWLSKDSDPTSLQHAIKALGKLLKNYPDTPFAADANYWIGNCHLRLGDNDRAVIYYQRILNDYFHRPISDLAQFNLAQIYETQNNPAVALAMYQSVTERSSNPALAAAAEERIRSLQLGRAPSDSTALEPESINSLGLDMPSERRSLVPPAKKPPDKPIITTAPHPETDDERVRTEDQPVPHGALPDEVETDDSPSTDIQSETIAPASENQEIRPKTNEKRSPARNVENSRAKHDVNLTLPRQLGLEVKTVVIDPGHGGKDTGAISDSHVHEKGVVLELALILRDLLVDRGYDVRLTRERDIYLPLRERTRMATMQGADLFVSVHANHAAHTGASGIETYYLALASDETAQHTAARENSGAGYGIKELDKLVTKIIAESKSVESRRLAQCIQTQLIASTKAIDRGVKHAPFVVLIGTKVPAVLVEIGFLSHPTEAEKLTKKTYQREVAEAIAKGIDRYVSSNPITPIKVDGGINE